MDRNRVDGISGAGTFRAATPFGSEETSGGREEEEGDADGADGSMVVQKENVFKVKDTYKEVTSSRHTLR